MTLEEFIPVYMETHADVYNKPETARQKQVIIRRTILPALGKRPLAAIGKMDIKIYISRLNKSGLGPKTVNNHLTVLSHILHEAKELDLLETIPTIKKLKYDPPTVQFLTPHQAKMLVMYSEPMWAQMVTFALNTGLRIGELRALQWEQINRRNRTVFVDRATCGNKPLIGKPKGRDRSVPLNKAAWEAIEQLDRSTKFVFALPLRLHEKPAPISYNRCELALKAARRHLRSGSFISWHTMRHTFASRLASKGVGLQKIKELLGHVDISTTLKYAHLCPSDLADSVAILDIQ
jgi:integrase